MRSGRSPMRLERSAASIYSGTVAAAMEGLLSGVPGAHRSSHCEVTLMRVGRFALVMAGSGWLLLWLRLSHTALGLDLYCDWTRDCSALLWTAAPTYVAMLGIVAPTVPISLALHREKIGPRYLRAAALVTSSVALIALALAIVAIYDSMWSNYVGP